MTSQHGYNSTRVSSSGRPYDRWPPPSPEPDFRERTRRYDRYDGTKSNRYSRHHDLYTRSQSREPTSRPSKNDRRRSRSPENSPLSMDKVTHSRSSRHGRAWSSSRMSRYSRHNPHRSRSRVPDSQQRKRKPGRYDDPNTDDELHNRSRSPPLERDSYRRGKEPRRFNHDKQICKATMATVTVPKSEAVSPMIIDDDSDEIHKTVETRHPQQPSDSTMTTTTESKKEDVSQAHTVDLESLDEPSSTAYSTASDSTKLAAEDRPARFPPASVDTALSSRSRRAPSALLLPIDAVVQPEADLLSLCHCGRRVNTVGLFTWGVCSFGGG